MQRRSLRTAADQNLQTLPKAFHPSFAHYNSRSPTTTTIITFTFLESDTIQVDIPTYIYMYIHYMYVYIYTLYVTFLYNEYNCVYENACMHAQYKVLMRSQIYELVQGKKNTLYICERQKKPVFGEVVRFGLSI